MSAAEIHLLDTPLPSASLLELLTNHLPHSLPVLRRLQYAANFSGNGLGTTPYSHVLYASRYSVEECLSVPSPPNKKQQEGKKHSKGRNHFAAAFVDLSRFPETQAWVYSTLEDYGVFDPTGSGSGSGSGTPSVEEVFGSSHSLPEEEAKECDQLLLTLLRRMRTIALQMPVELDPDFCSEERRANWREAREYLCMSAAAAATAGKDAHGEVKEGETGPKVMIGSLAEIHRHRLFLANKNKHGYGVQMHKTANIPDDIEWEVCQKWLFRTEALVSSPEKEAGLEKMMKEEGLVWDYVRDQKDVRLVQSRTSIKRQEDTLLGLPSVAVRDSREGRMVAWGFMAFDGTLMTLHVEEQYRGKGLAKAVACKVMRDHVKDYGDDGWGAADVFVENHRSQGVCRSIGGRVGWLLSWAVVDLSTVGDAL